MARTIRISKSKALNFKKLTFLYLIFIVFFFFSTSGDFIKQFVSLARTQKELNTRLLEQLNAYVITNSEEKALKDQAIKTLDQLQLHQQELIDFAKSTPLSGEKLREQKFTKKYILRDEPASKMHESLCEYILLFPSASQSNLAKNLGVNFENIRLKGPFKNQFFIETPNGAIGSIISHLETVVLTNTLERLKKESKELPIIKVNQTNDSTFLESFKNNYFVGENISFEFITNDSHPPVVHINEISLTPIIKGKHFIYKWSPLSEGQYYIEATKGSEAIRRKLSVIKPSLKFLETEQEIAAYIGEPISLTLDLTGMQQIEHLNFFSNGAKIVTKNNQLIVTPLFEGRFSIEMRAGNTLLDARSFFARKGKNPMVILKDISGTQTDLAKAHCLESVSKLWQVVNFNMTVIHPDGKVTKTKSQTRFLRNELRTIEAEAPAGSTIIFDQIRLLNVNGENTAMGLPLFISK